MATTRRVLAAPDRFPGTASPGSVLADVLDLASRVATADLVVTGEGLLDAESFQGKAVGGVVDLAVEGRVPVLVVAGEVYADELPDDLPASVEVLSLAERFGIERARGDVLGCVADVVGERLRDVL